MSSSAAWIRFDHTTATARTRHVPRERLAGPWRLAAVVLVAAGALLSSPVRGETRIESVNAFINHYRKVARARDLPATVACFSNDISLFPPDGPTVFGKAAVTALYEEFFKSSDSVDNKFAEERTFADDTVAVRQGISTYRERLLADGRIHTFRTRFVMVLVRERGAWQLATYAWQELKPDK